jgi:LuxR family maltose regulon positive regulatory protein
LANASESRDDLILRTKLHRPPVTEDLVCRTRLHELMDQGEETPLTLVSAPAGYGKSMLVSQWVEMSEEPCAWLSLDVDDSDLATFVSYLLASVRTRFPDACSQTESLISAPEQPTMQVLGGHLVNELDAVDTAFTLALDNYQRITPTSEVHELLRFLLEYPPLPLRLVVMTRHEPPLSMTTLRARDRVTEIRMQDLRFTESEISEFLEKTADLKVSAEALANLHHQTEGWAVALRLVSLHLSHVDDPDAFLRELRGGIQHTQKYLLEEVLARLSPRMREWLLKTSILDRFCPDLCDALCAANGSPGSSDIDGRQFVEVLMWGNLFAVSLDARGEWYRYHHLFQALLHEQLKRQSSFEEITALHLRACEWFENRGFIEEAIHHALAAGDAVAAAHIVERRRHEELDKDRWYVVKRWLDLLPEEIKQQRTALLLAQVRPLFEQHRLMEIPPILERVGPMLARDADDETLLGELDFYSGFLLIWLMGDAERALRHLDRARDRVPSTRRMISAEVELYHALARQMIGQGSSAVESIEDRIRSEASPEALFLSHLVGAQTFISLLSGDLAATTNGAHRLISVAEEGRNTFSETWGPFTLANAHLQSYRLDEALQGFGVLVEKRDSLPKKAVIEALAGLVLTQQAMNRTAEAQATLKLLLDFSRTTGDPLQVLVAESSRARLSILLGDTTSASQWARLATIEHHAPSMLFFVENPSLTQARARIAAGSDDDLGDVVDGLATLRQQVEGLHNTYQTIEIMVLQAAAMEVVGRPEEALTFLEEALALGGPGGWIRPFLEPGPSVARLLNQLHKRDGLAASIEPILAAAERAAERAAAVGAQQERSRRASEVLTNREYEILELLAKRMRDKEIAARLFISAQTVNSHLRNIYQKLGVSDRRQAVVKATEMGILALD